MTGPIEAGERSTSVMQDAVRLLLLIHSAAEQLGQPIPAHAPPDSVAVLRTQVLLQKLDFWVRNPDYLADELLTRFEDEGDPRDLALAGDILDSDQPEVRSYPMLRHLFGAYEPLDEALAVLAAPGLVLRRRKGIPGHVIQHDYYLTTVGRSTAEAIVATAPAFDYYVRRTRLVVDLAAGKRGTALRDIQYLHTEYAEAQLGAYIAGISDRARKRLQMLRADYENAV
jgi:hypothetical protein